MSNLTVCVAICFPVWGVCDSDRKYSACLFSSLAMRILGERNRKIYCEWDAEMTRRWKDPSMSDLRVPLQALSQENALDCTLLSGDWTLGTCVRGVIYLVIFVCLMRQTLLARGHTSG